MKESSYNYSQRLNNIIPGGAHTYSRGDDQYPSNAPQILAKGKDAYVWDADGNKFLDYGMALRAVTLGYANERVNQAAFRQIENGVNLTRPSLIELEAAEAMVSIIPGADMVKFAKNGSNVTSAAVKLARAYTGKKFVCIPRQHPFFSFDDWFIGVTPVQRGIPSEHYSTTLLFDYNKIETLENLFNQYPGQIAAVMLEPATTVTPCNASCDTSRTTERICAATPTGKNNFLHQVQNLCRKNGAVFILDEMITGFRWHLNGAQTYFGVQPDLCTFGKGIANGFSVACLAGKREIMYLGGIKKEGMERTFLISTTHGAEMPGMGALVETIKIYQEQNIIAHLWKYGERLCNGIDDIARTLGIQQYFFMDGGYVALNYVAKNSEGNISMEYRTLFAQEMIKNGVLIPWIAQSYSHGEEELKFTLGAVEKSLSVYRKALAEGIEKYLVGKSIKPVFRKFN